MRLAPVMLALLLALSPGAVAVQASAPVASAGQTPSVEASEAVRPAVNENTTAVLTLGADSDREAFDTPSLSLASSLTAGREEFRTELDVKTLDRRLANAATEEEKKRILNQYRYRIENRIISLNAKERQAAAAFSNDSISTAQYVRTLGLIDAEADEVRKSIRVLKNRVDTVSNFGMPEIERTLEGKLVPLEGPVRDRVGKSLRGETEPVRIYVATAESGVVLSMVTDQHYVREVFRADNRDASVTGSMSREEAENQIVQPQYPWAVNNSHSARQTIYTSLQMIRYIYQHPHGNLSVHVDIGTENVFREVQYKRLSGPQALPPGPGVSNTTSGVFGSENVTLTVNRTYAGGPLRVQLTNETGAPLDGTVAVGDDSVGRTGSDGVLWALGPSERFRVSATHDGTTVNVTATPVALSED